MMFQKPSSKQLFDLWKWAKLNTEGGPASYVDVEEKILSGEYAKMILDRIRDNDFASAVNYLQSEYPDIHLIRTEPIPTQPQQAPPQDPKPNPAPEPQQAPQDPIQQKLNELKDLIEDQAKPKTPKYDPKTQDYIKHPLFDRVARLVELNFQPCLVGPRGCGKSRMVEEIAKTLDLPCLVKSFGSCSRKSDIIGTKEIVEGKTVFMESDLLQSLDKKGIILIDEVMSGDPSITIMFNSLFEMHTRTLSLPHKTYFAHPELRFVFTSNTTGREKSPAYTATTVQDASLLRRMIIIPMDYHLPTEKKIIKQMNCPEDAAAFLAEKLRELRKKVKEKGVRYDASTGQLIQAVALITQAGYAKEEAFETAFLNPLSQSERLSLEIQV